MALHERMSTPYSKGNHHLQIQVPSLIAALQAIKILLSYLSTRAYNHLPIDLSGASIGIMQKVDRYTWGKDVGPLPRWMSEETIA